MLVYIVHNVFSNLLTISVTWCPVLLEYAFEDEKGTISAGLARLSVTVNLQACLMQQALNATKQSH